MDIADPFARQLMARYLRHRRTDVARLRAALEEDNLETIRQTGHNLHGSGGSYGLDRISEIGRCIEDAAEAGSHAALQTLIGDLACYVEHLEQP